MKKCIDTGVMSDKVINILVSSYDGNKEGLVKLLQNRIGGK